MFLKKIMAVNLYFTIEVVTRFYNFKTLRNYKRNTSIFKKKKKTEVELSKM